MNKFCAFGIPYLDNEGEIIEESENYYIVISKSSFYKLALSKNPKLIKVFETKQERDNWIYEQNYQYDSR